MSSFFECKVVTVGTEEETIKMFKKMLDNVKAKYQSDASVDSLEEQIKEYSGSEYEFTMEMICKEPEEYINSDYSSLYVSHYKEYYIVEFIWTSSGRCYFNDFAKFQGDTGINMWSIGSDECIGEFEHIAGYYNGDFDPDFDYREDIAFILHCANVEPMDDILEEILDVFDISKEDFTFYVPEGEKAPTLDSMLKEEYDEEYDEEWVKLYIIAKYYLFDIKKSEKYSRKIDANL